MDCNYSSQPVAEVWSFADSLEWLAPSGSVNELQRPSVTAKGTKKAGGRFHLVPLPWWSRTQLHTDLSFHHLCLQEISSFCLSASRWFIQIDIILSSKKTACILMKQGPSNIGCWMLMSFDRFLESWWWPQGWAFVPGQGAPVLPAISRTSQGDQ